MSIIELFREANQKLTGKHLMAIAAVLIISLISGIPSGIDPKLGGLSILITAPLSLGMATFFLNIVRGNEVRIEQLFDGFKNYVPALIVTLLMAIAVCLGLILLIIPGIIIALGLSMSMFILSDNPSMSAVDVLKASWEMMKGHKGDYFVFCLLCIGMAILGFLALIIGIFYVLPIIYAASALFYEKVRNS
jgi:uncharacterized membrane protein